jgi:hypothetical protein
LRGKRRAGSPAPFCARRALVRAHGSSMRYTGKVYKCGPKGHWAQALRWYRCAAIENERLLLFRCYTDKVGQRIKMRKLVFLSVAFALQTAFCWRAGYSVGYLPKEGGIKTKILRCKEESENSFLCKNIGSQVIFNSDTSGDQNLDLRHVNGRYIYKFEEPSNIGGLEVYSGDVNNDQISDLIVVRNRGGNGLGAEICDVIFLSSRKGGFSFSSFQSFGFDDLNLISVNSKTRIIQTFCIQSVHSYWVHRFFKIDDGRLALDSSISAKWIQFTGKSNRVETTRLSLLEKDSLLKKEHWPLIYEP